MADPALLLATILNPDVFTAKRTKRAAFMLTSIGIGDSESIAGRYVEILKRGQMPTWRQSHQILEQLIRYAGKSKEAVEQFVEAARKELRI